MKKFLKKLLLSLILIPTIFFMFACNAEPPAGPGNGNTGGESSQGGGSHGGGSQGGSDQGGSDQGGGSQGGGQQEDPVITAKKTAYSILNNLAKSDIYAGFENYELYVSKTFVAYGHYLDLSEINLTEEEWDACVAQSPNWDINPKMPEEEIDFILSYPRYYGLNANGEGYLYKKEAWNDITDPKFVEAVVNYQDKLIYDDGTNFSYTDSNYAPSTFKYDFSENKYKIAEIFAIIGSTSSYTDLSTNLVNLVDGLNSYYTNESYHFDEVEIQVNVDINILENSQYELVINAVYDTHISSSNDPNNPIAGAGDEANLYVDYTFKFDNNKLISIDVQDGYITPGNSWSSGDLRSYVKLDGTGKTKQEAFPSGCKVTIVQHLYERFKFEFNDFDATKLPDNTSEYESLT